MLREDAIRELKILKENYWDDDGYGHETKQYVDTMSALEMAIKALEQESCEDAISRKEAKKLAWDLELETCYDNERVVEMLDDLSSVTLVPKKCYNENYDYAECDQFVCSNCGIELQDWHRVERDIDTSDITYHQYEFKYCPNCGVRIDSKLPTA